MPTDGLTKTLFKQKHENFVRMIGLINISDKLVMKQRAAKKKKINQSKKSINFRKCKNKNQSIVEKVI